MGSTPTGYESHTQDIMAIPAMKKSRKLHYDIVETNKLIYKDIVHRPHGT